MLWQSKIIKTLSDEMKLLFQSLFGENFDLEKDFRGQNEILKCCPFFK